MLLFRAIAEKGSNSVPLNRMKKQVPGPYSEARKARKENPHFCGVKAEKMRSSLGKGIEQGRPSKARRGGSLFRGKRVALKKGTAPGKASQWVENDPELGGKPISFYKKRPPPGPGIRERK